MGLQNDIYDHKMNRHATRIINTFREEMFPKCRIVQRTVSYKKIKCRRSLYDLRFAFYCRFMENFDRITGIRFSIGSLREIAIKPTV